jgi:hypothetical protein
VEATREGCCGSGKRFKSDSKSDLTRSSLSRRVYALNRSGYSRQLALTSYPKVSTER